MDSQTDPAVLAAQATFINLMKDPNSTDAEVEWAGIGVLMALYTDDNNQASAQAFYNHLKKLTS